MVCHLFHAGAGIVVDEVTIGADTRFRRIGRRSARLDLRTDILLLALVVVVVAVYLFPTLEGDAQFRSDVEALIHLEVHASEDIGKDKVSAAKERLLKINSEFEIETNKVFIGETKLEDLINDYEQLTTQTRYPS